MDCCTRRSFMKAGALTLLGMGSVPRAWAATISALLNSVMRISCDVDAETGSADREAFPDLQPRHDLCMVLRGLLGFLDDLRTRVKPTRGVLDLSSATLPEKEVDSETSRGL